MDAAGLLTQHDLGDVTDGLDACALGKQGQVAVGHQVPNRRGLGGCGVGHVAGCRILRLLLLLSQRYTLNLAHRKI